MSKQILCQNYSNDEKNNYAGLAITAARAILFSIILNISSIPNGKAGRSYLYV